MSNPSHKFNIYELRYFTLLLGEPEDELISSKHVALTKYTIFVFTVYSRIQSALEYNPH